MALMEQLFRDWHQCFADSVLRCVADDMVFDGFYPYYFSQKKRVLFVAREARQIARCNYIDMLWHAYRENKHIGKQPINKNKFHSRMLRIAYGVQNGMPEWHTIPQASKIGDTVGEANGLGFAFMNISKLSNESKHWHADWQAINAAHALSTQGRNFIQEQVAIMEPHIIFTMNLGEKINSLGPLTQLHAIAGAKSYVITIGDYQALLIDIFHCSAPKKQAIRDFYVPICELIRQSASLRPMPVICPQGEHETQLTGHLSAPIVKKIAELYAVEAQVREAGLGITIRDSSQNPTALQPKAFAA